jgi:hypothetical protein
MHLSLVLEANLGRRGAAPPKQKALGDGQDSGGRKELGAARKRR